MSKLKAAPVKPKRRVARATGPATVAEPAPAGQTVDTGYDAGPVGKGAMEAEPAVEMPVARAPRTADPGGVSKDGAAPSASGAAPAESDPEAMVFEGKVLRFDREVLVGVLRGIEESAGIDARASFVGRFRTANLLWLLRGSERPGLYRDIVRGLDDASAQLDAEHEEFLERFESTANDTARAILDESESKLLAERERLGLTSEWVGTDPGALMHTLGNKDAGAQLRSAASELLPFATAVEVTGKAYAEALEKLGKAAASDPFGLTTKPLYEESEAQRKRWLEAGETFFKEKQPRIATQPSLAMYTDDPEAAAGRLRGLAAMSDADLGDAMGREISDRLGNIATVRPQIGKGLSIWRQPHLRRVTLDQMAATPIQREVVDRKVRATPPEGQTSLLFTLLAIGLGIIAAIPTAGASVALAATIAVAATAGAMISMYKLGEEVDRYRLAAAAGATDFEKAKAISGNDSDAWELALAVVTAVVDVFAAALAFKALKTAYLAAKAGKVAAALDVVRIADKVGVTGAAKQKILADAVAGLSDDAIEEVGKTMARSGGVDRAGVLSRLAAGAGEGAFKAQLLEAGELLEKLPGEIHNAAREAIESGRVRLFSEESLKEVFGAEKGAAKWAAYGATSDDLYSKATDTIFLSVGESSEGLAGALVHESTHRMGSFNPKRADDFLSEAVVEFAERDFYVRLYGEGGPLAGRAPTSQRITDFLGFTEDQLILDIEKRYYAQKDYLPPELRVKFKNVQGYTPRQIAGELEVDVEAYYKRTLPRDGGS